jgi:3-hydroxybutyryl-CoA dehydrogenase
MRSPQTEWEIVNINIIQMAIKKTGLSDITIGVVGIGLMGSSIISSLLICGHRVKAIAPLPLEKEEGALRIHEKLFLCASIGILSSSVSSCLSRLTISENYRELGDCHLVLECVIEKQEIKKQVYEKIAKNVPVQTIIASNTSAIPIDILQKLVANPERFLGIHWAEPAYATRFLEITCGGQTDIAYADWVFELAHHWRKEPTLLRKDIRGFITNRLMYALCREALHLVEMGNATIEDIDRALKYDFGSWMTLMGIFRRMDFVGLKDFAEILNKSFPVLSNTDRVPLPMQRLVDVDAKGIKDGNGFYHYTANAAKEWAQAFTFYNKDIYELAERYPCGKAKETIGRLPHHFMDKT